MIVLRVGSDVGELLARHPKFAQHVHRDPAGSGWLFTDATRKFLERDGRSGRRIAESARAADLSSSMWEEAGTRIHAGVSAAISPPLPGAVRAELQLWLYARPRDRVEPMGRGRFPDPNRLPAPAEDLIYLDIPGGRRAYTFRRLRSPVADDARHGALTARLAAMARWGDDPDARLVLSIGGGGYRLFAALPALQVVELLLRSRRKVHEVWGSSGGALLGYAFAKGLDLRAIESLGYALFHGANRALPGIHLRSLAPLVVRAVADKMRGRIGAPELTAWVEALEQLSPPETRTDVRVPYYAMVSNPRWRHPIAFAGPEDISPHCRNLFVPCDGRAAAATSMSIPFLMRPLRGLQGFENDSWFDGSIVDENPVMLPFVKWLRDRKAAPDTTPKRLKIILVNLNMRLTESQLLTSLVRSRVLGSSVVARLAELGDLMLDSKTHSLVRTLTELDDVEIMCITLTMGRLNFIARRDIPAAIRTGQIVEGWRHELFARGEEHFQTPAVA